MLLFASLLPLRILRATIFSWSLQPRLPTTCPSPTSPCFFASRRSSRAPLLHHHSQELVLNALQEPPGLLGPCCVVPPADTRLVQEECPKRTRGTANVRLLVAGCRWPLLPHLLGQGAYSKLPQQCHLCWCAPASLPISSQSDHRPPPGRAPCVPAASSHTGQLPLLAFPAGPP